VRTPPYHPLSIKSSPDTAREGFTAEAGVLPPHLPFSSIDYKEKSKKEHPLICSVIG